MAAGGAVVVDKSKSDTPIVWHSYDNDIWTHNLDGTCDCVSDDYNLDKPYTEPRKGTVWVNVWRKRSNGNILTVSYQNEEDYKMDLADTCGIEFQCIASFKHDWTERDKI